MGPLVSEIGVFVQDTRILFVNANCFFDVLNTTSPGDEFRIEIGDAA